MKIEKINIEQGRLDELGVNSGIIGDIYLDRLGPLVVLAGPNGAGKSRFFEVIKKICSKTSELPATLKIRLENINKDINHFEKLITTTDSSHPNVSQLKDSLNNRLQARQEVEKQLICCEMIKFSSEQRPIKPIFFFSLVQNYKRLKSMLMLSL